MVLSAVLELLYGVFHVQGLRPQMGELSVHEKCLVRFGSLTKWEMIDWMIDWGCTKHFGAEQT
jgi:hypothetical protein